MSTSDENDVARMPQRPSVEQVGVYGALTFYAVIAGMHRHKQCRAKISLISFTSLRDTGGKSVPDLPKDGMRSAVQAFKLQDHSIELKLRVTVPALDSTRSSSGR
jgi:hypothetical protein